LASGRNAVWAARDLGVDWKELTWDITGAVGEAGEYEVAFLHAQGKDGIRIGGVRKG
jgi:hypothetical protein